MAIQQRIPNAGGLEEKTKGGNDKIKEEQELKQEMEYDTIFDIFYGQMSLVEYLQEYPSHSKNGIQSKIIIPRDGVPEDHRLFLRITKESNGSKALFYSFEFRSRYLNSKEKIFPFLDDKKLVPGFYEVPKDLKVMDITNLF